MSRYGMGLIVVTALVVAAAAAHSGLSSNYDGGFHQKCRTRI